MCDRERTVAVDFVLEKVERWVHPRVQIVPATKFDQTELGVIEGVPVHETSGLCSARLAVEPAQHVNAMKR